MSSLCAVVCVAALCWSIWPVATGQIDQQSAATQTTAHSELIDPRTCSTKLCSAVDVVQATVLADHRRRPSVAIASNHPQPVRTGGNAQPSNEDPEVARSRGRSSVSRPNSAPPWNIGRPQARPRPPRRGRHAQRCAARCRLWHRRAHHPSPAGAPPIVLLSKQ